MGQPSIRGGNSHCWLGDPPGTSAAVADLSNADQLRSNPTDAKLRDANATRARRLEIRQRVKEMTALGVGAHADDPDDDGTFDVAVFVDADDLDDDEPEWDEDDSKEIKDLLYKWDEDAFAACWNAVNAAEADWDADDADDYTMYPDLSDYEPE